MKYCCMGICAMSSWPISSKCSCSDNWCSVSVRQELYHPWHTWIQVTHRLDGDQPMKMHNCSHGMTAMKKLSGYWTRIGTIPSKGPLSTSWWSNSSIPSLVKQHLFSDDHPLWLQLYEWQYQHTAPELFLHNILQSDGACSTSDGVFNVHDIHICYQQMWIPCPLQH